MTSKVLFEGVVLLERHHADLPVYALVPDSVARATGNNGTFVTEALVNGTPVGRRSIKPWGDGRWFVELTKAHCKRLGVADGDRIALKLLGAPVLPDDLEHRLRDEDLWDAWWDRTAADRRALAEQVFDAKKPETRAARIDRILAALKTSAG